MKMSRKRILPKIWLSAIAICALFLGFAGATVKASDNGGFLGLTAVSDYLFSTQGGSPIFSSAAVVDTVQLSSSTYTVDEGAGFATITVTRTDAAATTATVNYTTTAGSATPGATCGGAADYVNTSGTLTFNAGVTSQSFVVPICDDAIFEGSETFNVDLSAPNGTLLGTPSSAIVTITDNDATQPGTLQFSASNYNVGENSGTVTLTVTRTGGINGTVSANYTLNDGTATGGTTCAAGVDYINPAGAPDGTVTLANGVTSATFTVTICADGITEGSETFTATLSNATGGATIGASNTATVTITDTAGNAGVLQFDPATYTVSEGVGTVQLTVTRTGGTTGAVSANYILFNNQAFGGSACGSPSAANPVDYINTPGTIVFQNGQTSATISVTICNDTVDEFPDSEAFTVLLTSATGGATLGANSSAVVNILDDENGVFQFNPTTYTVNESAGTVSVTITRSDLSNSGANGTASVNYSTSNGPSPSATGGASCTSGVDYISQSGTLTFGPGVTSQSFTITICNDAAFEISAENFTVTLSNPTNGALVGPNNTATVTINDDDTAQPGTFSIAPTSTSVTEGGAVTFTVTRSGGTDTAVAVTVTVANGTATGTGTNTCPAVASNNGASDFRLPSNSGGNLTNPFTLNFANSQAPGGTQTQTFTIQTCDDLIFEPNETFTVSLSGQTGGSTLGANSSSTVTIIDNDAQPGTLNFNPATYNVSEAVGNATLTVTRTQGTDTAVSANYVLTDGTATGGASCTTGVDYINTGGAINFASGSNSGTISVPICNDTLDENNETFTVTLTNPTGGVTIGANPVATVTILDDEEGTVQFSTGNFSVNESAGTATITVNRTSNGGNVGTVTVDYTLTNGTATGGTTCAAGVDYINPAGTPDGTLTFGPGVTSQTFTVQICPDTLNEANETINITLGNVTGNGLIGTQNTAVLTIVDDDAAPTISISNVTQAEGNTGTTNFVFNVNISAASGQAITVNYATANGTATGGAACGAGIDYVTQSGTLTFAAGSTTAQTVTVVVCGDNDFEPNETFFVNLSGATNSTVPAGTQGVGTITNDDGGPGTISVSSSTANPTRVIEGNSGTSTVTFTLTNNNPNAQQATVNFTTANGTATGGAACGAGVDYVTQSGTITFAANSNTPQTVTVTVCGDTLKEANETFFINLSGAVNTTIPNNTQGVVIIVDDDNQTRADFDRDGRTDFSVFRPSNGFWYILQSINGLFRAQQFGANGDIPVPGDYDNDGATDLAYYRPSTGTFNIFRTSDNVAQQITLGVATDIPVQGDYDGDGDTDVAVFRPSSGTFFTSTNPATNFGAIQFGQNGDIPVPADYDGDGKTDVAVYRPNAFAGGASAWFIRPSSGAAPYGIQYGSATDIPVTGDIDGDGKADLNVFRTAASGLPTGVSGAFFTFQSLTQTSTGVAFGQAGDIPAIGDYDGDGRDDVAVFRTSGNPQAGAYFYVLQSTSGFTARQFGAAGDIPIPLRYQPSVGTVPAPEE